MEHDEPAGMERDEVIARLRAMPERLRAALERPANAGAIRTSETDEWTPREVFDHIRATDMLHAAEVFAIVAESEPALPGGDERRLAEQAGVHEDDLEIALAAYATRRGELVRLLERLDDAEWRRAGVHRIWGRTSIERYARHIVAHEAEHLVQIDNVID